MGVTVDERPFGSLWGATRDCGLKEDEERLYVLKWHLSGALSNPNLLPV